MKVKHLILSDLHLGSKHAQPKKLHKLLKDIEVKSCIYLVGDIIDGWVLKRNSNNWDSDCLKAVRRLLKFAQKGVKIKYITGNHDDFLRSISGNNSDLIFQLFEQVGVEIVDQSHVRTKDGNLLLIHGDQFDNLVKHKWLGLLGSFFYELSIHLSKLNSTVRSLLGLKPWSLSKYLKKSVKSAKKFIDRFRSNVVLYALQNGYDGVICGHIHNQEYQNVNGVKYYNVGCFTEHNNYMIVTTENEIKLMDYE